MSEPEETSGFTPPSLEELNEWLTSYEVTDLLACGGMGAVYQARQISLDRQVAIKILPSELAVDESFRKSFEAEGKAMAKLSHSNLVGVYDFGEISNMLFLVMEYVEGSTLYESKGDSAIEVETAVTLIRSVASGLADAHRIGLVHRDIKPANILISTDLVPKLGDFGLAVPDSDIESGLVMGTPAYLAPEVLENPSAASLSSDTYALGVILYEMLTGDSIEHGAVMDLNRVPKVGNLPRIVQKAVDPKPLLRYQTAEKLEEALKEWLRKPKTGGLAVKPSGPIIRPDVAPVATSKGAGGGMLFAVLGIGIIAAISWITFVGMPGSGDDDSSDDPAMVDGGNPPGSADGSQDKDRPTLDDLRASQQEALSELQSLITEERAQNRRDFLEASGAKGDAFLRQATADTNGLPRYFMPGEVTVGDELLSHLQEHAARKQDGIDRDYHRKISTLHGTALSDLRPFKGELPEKINLSWQAWVEWLGEDPLTLVRRPLSGLWQESSIPDGVQLRVSPTGSRVLVINGEEIELNGHIDYTEAGGITLQDPSDKGPAFPWKLHWRGDRLEGVDANGGERLLLLKAFNYSDLLKKPVSINSPPIAMTPVSTGEIEQPMMHFEDPEVAALTRNYRKALVTKIEPLQTGYVRVLREFKKSHQEEAEVEAVEQIDDELERVDAINWRPGFLLPELIQPPGELPKEANEKQAIFQKEFERRFETLQRTYLSTLEKMLRVRKGRGDNNIAEIEEAIKKVGSPEGAVKARFIKIEALEAEGVDHASIASLNIVDIHGENLPYKDFSRVRVSSHERNDEGRDARGELAIDGNSDTFWHSAWQGNGADFPHWLSFELGGEHWIKGFRLTPRESQLNRSTDVINWRFYVSQNGRDWTVVATGKFQKGGHRKEHMGFEREE